MVQRLHKARIFVGHGVCVRDGGGGGDGWWARALLAQATLATSRSESPALRMSTCWSRPARCASPSPSTRLNSPRRARRTARCLAARQTHPLSAGPCRDGSSARALGKSPSASYSRAIEGSRFVAGLCDCLGLHQLVVSSTSWPWTKLVPLVLGPPRRVPSSFNYY